MDIAFLVKTPRVLDQMDEGFEALMSVATAGQVVRTQEGDQADAAPAREPDLAAGDDTPAPDDDGTVFGITLLIDDEHQDEE